MYYLRAENSFDAAHFLSGYEGKCSNLHGHRWRVVVQIKGDQVQEDGQIRGMLLDFSDFKEEVKALTDVFDHSFIYEKGTLRDGTRQALEQEGFEMHEVDFRPTAECFAKYFYDAMKQKGLPVYEVTVYETPNNCASYGE